MISFQFCATAFFSILSASLVLGENECSHNAHSAMQILAHAEDCEKYITCAGEVKITQSCPVGSVWNALEKTCTTDTATVKCRKKRKFTFMSMFGAKTAANSDIEASLSCIAKSGQCPAVFDPTHLVLRSHENCEKYYLCISFLPVVLSCPVGLHFNRESCQCDFRESAGCEVSTPVVTDSTPVVTDSTPAETDSTPVQTDSTPVETDSTPAETDSTPVETDSTPAQTDSTSAETDSTPVETDSTPAETDSTPVVTDSTPVVTDSTPMHTYSTPAVTVSTPTEPSTTPTQSGTTSTLSTSTGQPTTTTTSSSTTTESTSTTLATETATPKPPLAEEVLVAIGKAMNVVSSLMDIFFNYMN